MQASVTANFKRCCHLHPSHPCGLLYVTRRLFTGGRTQRVANTFRFRAFAICGVLLLVHVALFAAFTSKLEEQSV